MTCARTLSPDTAGSRRPTRGADDGAVARSLDTILKGAGLALGARAGAGLLGYAFVVLVARVLGAEGFGLYTLVYGIVVLASVLGRLGLGETLLRFVAIYRGAGAAGRTKGALRFALLASLTASGALTVALAVGADVIAARVFAKPEAAAPLRVLALAIVPANVALVALTATRACRVMAWTALTQGLVAPALQLGAAALLLAGGAGLKGVVSAVVIAQGAAALRSR